MTAQSPPEAGEPTEEYKNAWASIQHMVMVDGASWSGREKNCVYLNMGARVFANVSSVSRADYEDDSRAVATVDWDDDGRLDLILKNRTAPRLRFLRNQGADAGGFLKVDLRGKTCNRDAIGATVFVELEGRTLRKTLFAGDGYLSQSSKRLHFGLGDAVRVKRLTVRWPGGDEESFEDLAGNARYRVVQGSGIEPVEASTHEEFAQLEPRVETRHEGSVRRIVLADKLPMSPVTLPSFADPKRKVKDFEGAPLLINLWETTCAACAAEFADFRERGPEIVRSGLRIAAMTLDEGPQLAEARKRIERFGLGADAGYADGRLKQVLEVFFLEVTGKSDDVPLPTSLLLDRAGQLVVIYQGAIDVDRLLDDVARLRDMDPKRASTTGISGGLWVDRGRRDFKLLTEAFDGLGHELLSTYYAEQ